MQNILRLLLSRINFHFSSIGDVSSAEGTFQPMVLTQVLLHIHHPNRYTSNGECTTVCPMKYKVFQKELYNFESSYKFIEKTCTVFCTVIMPGIVTVQCDFYW
jgi:hypothetical protein